MVLNLISKAIFIGIFLSGKVLIASNSIYSRASQITRIWMGGELTGESGEQKKKERANTHLI